MEIAYVMGIFDSIIFAIAVTAVVVFWAWCIAFVVVYKGGEAIKKGKGEEDAKFFIKITKDLFKWK